MKLTTKGRYAVTAMMDLALQNESADSARVALVDISERQGISLSYLEQLFANLRKAGLVDAVRGPGGGYAISKPSVEISIAEILSAVDENLDLTCGSGSACGGDHDPCLTHGLWSNLSAELLSFLDNKKLADIIRRPNPSAATQTKPITSQATSQNFSGIPIELS